MITWEQIEKHCTNKYCSKILFATLDTDHSINDYWGRFNNYFIPAGTIIELRLFIAAPADLHINGHTVPNFPYDAATLLEDE